MSEWSNGSHSSNRLLVLYLKVMNKIKTLLKSLDKLNLPQGSFVITGSGPIGIRDIREIDDLDVIVRKEIFDKLKHEHNYDGKNIDGHLELGEIEIGYKWQDSEEKAIELLKDSELIDGYPFVKLKYIIEWKQSLAREKDKHDLEMIEKYLKEQK